MEPIFFTPTQFDTEIVGESNYQKAIREIVLYKDLVDKDDTELKITKLLAVLIPEDDNKFDPGNAVRVDIEDKTVGYLDKTNAKSYRISLAKLNLPVQPCTCYATAYGKRPEKGKMMVFGIWLNLEVRNLVVGIKPRKKFLGLF